MPNEELENVFGWNVPKDTIPCWVIENAERLNSLRENKPFRDCRPPCYFKLLNRIDNNYLHGHLGNFNSLGEKFHSDSLPQFAYFQKYESRQSVYFSFDRVTLYRLIEIMPTNQSSLTFVLKRVDNPKAITPNRAFMIMPFKHLELNTLYQEHIKNFLLKEMNIQILRADDFNDNDIIIDTIYNQIDEAEFIISETSHPNKNVFYEFGYAAAKEKEIITIQNTEIEKNLFFDRGHIRAILYSLNNISDFQQQLKNTVNAIRARVSSKN